MTPECKHHICMQLRMRHVRKMKYRVNTIFHRFHIAMDLESENRTVIDKLFSFEQGAIKIWDKLA